MMMFKQREQGQIVILLGLISLLTGLSGSSTMLALPKISQDFSISNSMATWTVTVGLITTTILLVMFGHIGDLISKNDVFIFGSVFFIIGSLITGISPAYWILLVGRLIQAVGSAMIMANSMGIVSDYFPDATRAEALATLSMFTSVGSISGPAFGGFLISLASWRWIFLINVPLGILVVVWGYFMLHVRLPKRDAVSNIWHNSNWVGQNIFTVGVIIFFLSGTFIQMPKWGTLGFIGVAVGIILTFYSFIQDSKAKTPWINPELLHNMDYLVSVVTLLIAMLVNAISNILLPFYLQGFLQINALNSGLIMMLQSLTMLFVTPISGYLADHWNRYYLLILGLGFLTVSQIGYALYPSHNNLFLIIWPIVLNGVGMGLFLSPNNALTMNTVPKNLSGVAGSLNSLARTFGMTVGVSFGSALLFLQLPGIRIITPSTGSMFLHAFDAVFWAGAIGSLAGLGIAVYRLERVKKESTN